MQNYLSPEEVATKLSVQTTSVRAWLRTGEIRGVKLGRIWRISEDEIQRFLNLKTRTQAV